MKQVIATALDRKDIRRINRLADLEASSEAALIRKMILRELPHLEREVLGAEAARKALDKMGGVKS